MKHLFLDLEDTVCTPAIEGWHRVELINIEPIKAFMQKEAFDKVHLFSFALHDAHQVTLFKKHLLPWLQEALGVPIDLIPSVDEDILPLCATAKKLHPQRVDFVDVVDFWSKDLAFLLFVQQHPMFVHAPEEQCVHFIDDAIVDQTFGFPRLNLRGHMHHIDSITGQ